MALRKIGVFLDEHSIPKKRKMIAGLDTVRNAGRNFTGTRMLRDPVAGPVNLESK